MEKKKFLKIIAGAFFAASVVSAGGTLHNLVMTSNEQYALIEKSGIEEEFKFYQMMANESAKAEYFDGLINEWELYQFVNTNNNMSIHEFIREEQPFSKEDQQTYNSLSEELGYTMKTGLGAMMGTGLAGAAALYALIFSKTEEKNEKNVNNNTLNETQASQEL